MKPQVPQSPIHTHHKGGDSEQAEIQDEGNAEAEAEEAEVASRHRQGLRYVVQFSGGAGSWASARRLVDRGENVELLVACTNSEADDWWPFVNACQADLDIPMTVLDNGGRTIWDVFAEQRFLGNTRVDLCSRILKREPLRKWLDANRNPATDIVVIGFDWTEQPRIDKAARYWDPWTVVAPLADPPYVEKWALLAELQKRGIPVPDLYDQGFPHNNCGGACVKAGQAQWERLLRVRRSTYMDAEAHEESLRADLGDVSILRDRTGGQTTPLTLRAFRERLEEIPSMFDAEDWGACSCMEEPLERPVTVLGRSGRGERRRTPRPPEESLSLFDLPQRQAIEGKQRRKAKE